MAFKMYGKSPMTKKLIGKQANLPAELKAKIQAAPESPAKMKKAPAKMAKDPAMKMKKAPTKMKKAPMRKDKVSYSDAYNKLKPTKSGGRYDEKNKKNYNSEAEFTAAAKAYNAKKNTPKKVETKKVTKVEVKTAKPELKKALTEKEVRKAKRKAIVTKIFGDGSKRKAYEANKKKRENRSPTGRMKNKASKFRRPGDNM
tara:strand:+ start:318 stop:917 length:600 start_codon:yes stop_codon:yes gene_type:complete